MAYYPEFERLFTIHFNRIDEPKAWIAEQIGVDVATIYRWLNGESRPKDALTVLKIIEVLEIQDIEAQRDLLKAAGHKEHFVNEPVTNFHSPSTKIKPSAELDSDTTTLQHISPTKLAKVPSNWEDVIASSLRTIVERSNWGHVLFLLIGLILWLLSAEFIAPVFDIALSPEQRFTACVGYAIATLVVPVVIGLATSLQQNTLPKSESRRMRYHIKFLQTTGAIVAFHTFLISFLLIALMWFNISGSPMSGVIRQSMMVASLLMSYVYARKILEGRFQAHAHDIKLYSADYLFCVVFVLIGPLTAIGLYYFVEQLSSQPVGVGVLCLLFALALWHYRKQNTEAVSEIGMITVLGVVIPFCILLVFTLNYSPTVLTIENMVPLGIFVIFFLAETMLIATLLVRNRPALTIQGMIALLILAYAAVLILYLHLWSGFLWIPIALFVLVASGRTSFRTYFWVHDSFWVLQIAAIAALWLFIYGLVYTPFVVLGFMVLSGLCIYWAFHSARNPLFVKQQPVL